MSGATTTDGTDHLLAKQTALHVEREPEAHVAERRRMSGGAASAAFTGPLPLAFSVPPKSSRIAALATTGAMTST